MKATTIAIVSAGLCAVLLGSCQKSGYNSVTPASTGMQTSKTSDGSQSDLRFMEGTLNTTSLTVQSGGRYLADLGGLRTWNLFYPAANEGLPLHMGFYDNMTLMLKLAPKADVAAIHLIGSVSTSQDGDLSMGRKVDFAITTPMEFTVNTGPITLTESTNFVDLLKLKLDKLGANIPREMWLRAMDENSYVIYVSESRNSELYHLMLNNLEAQLQMGTTTTYTGPPMEHQTTAPVSTKITLDPRGL